MTKNFFLILLSVFLFSCSNNDDEGTPIYHGEYRIDTFNNITAPECGDTNSIFDLKITPAGRFTQKIYTLDINNVCTLSETLEGNIIQTGTFYGAPFGEVEYDNSNRNFSFATSNGDVVDGRYVRIIFSNDEPGNAGQYFYTRND
jgi:hypothetical protein